MSTFRLLLLVSIKCLKLTDRRGHSVRNGLCLIATAPAGRLITIR